MERMGLCPIHSITCRADAPLSYSLDKLSSVLARLTCSMNCRVNGIYQANGPLSHSLDNLSSK